MNINRMMEQVEEFRRATALPVYTGAECDIDTHRAVIREELEEAVDGLTDSIVTLAGLALDGPEGADKAASDAVARIVLAMQHIGFRPNECMDIVHAANMSKLCSDDEVDPTIQYYAELGVECTKDEVSQGEWAIKCAETVIGFDGKEYKSKKLLKCINWHEPDWSNMSHWAESDLVDLIEG